MSGTVKNTAISKTYLDDIRKILRISSTSTDGEIRDLIHAARNDLILGGVKLAKVRSMSDSLIKRAVSTYVKAEYGLDNPDSEKYRAAFTDLKQRLLFSDEYRA